MDNLDLNEPGVRRGWMKKVTNYFYFGNKKFDSEDF